VLDATAENIRHILENAGQILVITHVSPDGDAISSLTAMGLALKQMGKQYTLVNDDGLPERFQFLALADEVRTTPKPEMFYDLIVALDCADLDRLGDAYSCLPEPKPAVINIDHHPTNTLFGQINLIMAEANATAEILYQLFRQIDIKITPDIAAGLLSGLVADTLNFRTAGVTAETLRVASTLMDAGADLYDVSTQALNLKTLSTLRMWQVGLNNMQLDEGVLWTSISNAERRATGHMGGSSFGLGNMLADVYQAAMSAVLLEMEDGHISVGFRCRPPFSVSELAQSLGGGGHHLAAGCTVSGPLEKAQALVISASRESIRRQRATLRKDSDGGYV